MSFRKDFIWGAATASYQIEGAAYEDGKGPSVWDRFSHEPGKILEGHTGDVACDHYHRFREDVALMKEMGVKNYRFSISWPRLIPQGVGEVNEKGVQFYSDLIDELIAAGIRPIVTLFHWDYPAALQARGAWENPESPKWFEAYAELC
ncbi:MAG: family 1 glycosylhydrolase, partial [Clostridia bacterium]|nr:family 1 glycosylhydrolase [Clostridia bacterium]